MRSLPALLAISALLLAGETTEEGPPILKWFARLRAGDAAAREALTRLAARDPGAFLNTIRDGARDDRLLALDYMLEQPAQGIHPLVEALLVDPDVVFRTRVAITVTRRGLFRFHALPPLLAALQGDDDDLRRPAATALGFYRGPDPDGLLVPALIVATKDRADDVRIAAWQSLGAQSGRSQQARTAVNEALHAPEASHKVAGLTGLTWTTRPSRRQLDRCLALASDRDGRVRKEAVWTLSFHWRRLGLGHQRDAARHARPAVREAACRAMAVHERVVSPELLHGLLDASDDVRWAALESVAQIGDSSPAVATALVALLSAEDRGLAVRAARTLVQLGIRIGDAAICLAHQVGARQPAILRAARLEEIADIGAPAAAALPILEEHLASPSAQIRLATAWAISTVSGDPECVLREIERNAASDDDHAIARAALLVRRLGETAGRTVPRFEALLDDRRPGVRRSACLALGFLGSRAKPSIRRLQGLLEDRRDEDGVVFVRDAAAAALWRLGDRSQRVGAVLAAALDHRPNATARSSRLLSNMRCNAGSRPKRSRNAWCRSSKGPADFRKNGRR